MLEVRLYRGQDGEGALQSYSVPRRESQTVLDVVTTIQREIDPALAYRFACRVGMCGSCAMMVNGVPRWTCRTHVDLVAKDGKLTLEPLRSLPHIRDLVADMVPFFDKMQAAGGRFIPLEKVPETLLPIDPASTGRQEADAAIECIGCGVCYAACDVVAWKPDYVGPAALNRVWTLVNDERDGDRSGHLSTALEAGGCLSCHGIGSCAAHCPNALNPTRSIAGLKRSGFRVALGGKL